MSGVSTHSNNIAKEKDKNSKQWLLTLMLLQYLSHMVLPLLLFSLHMYIHNNYCGYTCTCRQNSKSGKTMCYLSCTLVCNNSSSYEQLSLFFGPTIYVYHVPCTFIYTVDNFWWIFLRVYNFYSQVLLMFFLFDYWSWGSGVGITKDSHDFLFPTAQLTKSAILPD